ncbi:tyrosine-type recombinase/integrase [Vibrio vulnificus]|uniref:tyrosine-type recombinase/integrase n=1 Tax=Vibrio vulnificus TaxID=672 RepID=UPI0005F0CD2B|nr:tyrosine-type recombinase/integrase [Vibrio vulnificus]HDY7887120.1 tyrosine-type recombinase/integrase [Vibrio vulnificus]
MTTRKQINRKLLLEFDLEGKKQVEIVDATVHYYHALVTPKSITHIARVGFNKKRHYKKLGTFPTMPIPTARKLANEFALSIQSGEYNPHAEMVFEHYIETHYLPMVRQKNRTGKESCNKFRNTILPALGRYTLGEFEREGHRLIGGFLTIKAQSIKAATFNRYHSELSGAFRHAIDLGFIHRDKSPMIGIKKRKEDNKGKKIMPDNHQLKALMAYCAQEPHYQAAADLILLLLYTGLRVSEALSLTQANIAKDRSSFVLTCNKSDRPIRLPLSHDAKIIIERRLQNTWNHYLFPSVRKDNCPMKPPRAYMDKLKKKVGLVEFGFHHCRAIFSSLAAKESLHTASKLLNHSDIHVTTRYLYPTEQELQATADYVAKQLS